MKKIASKSEAKVNKSFGITENSFSHSRDYCYCCIKSDSSKCQALLWLINWSGHEWENTDDLSERGFKHPDRCGYGRHIQTLLWILSQIENGVFINIYGILRIWQNWHLAWISFMCFGSHVYRLVCGASSINGWSNAYQWDIFSQLQATIDSWHWMTHISLNFVTTLDSHLFGGFQLTLISLVHRDKTLCVTKRSAILILH